MTTTSPMIPTRVLRGRNTKSISVTPTIEATPNYADGDVIGGKMTLSDLAREAAGSGALVWGHVYSLVDIGDSIPIRVLIFNEDPSNSTFTANAALSGASADLSKIVGVLNLDQKLDLGTPVMLYAAQPLVLPYRLAAGADAYAVAVIGGAFNAGSTGDLTFVFGAEQD